LIFIAVQIWNSGYLSQPVKILSRWLPITPTVSIDPNSIEGIAYATLQKDPYRSDAASKAIFADILNTIDGQVRTGDIINVEGYYNQFAKLTQEKLRQNEYQTWGPFWNSMLVTINQQ
jgi:hypothetical protein